MGRAMREKRNAVHLVNRPASTVSGIEHLRIEEKSSEKFQAHPITAASTLTNQSTCTRCGGLLVNDCYMDVLDGISKSRFSPKRCVQCGEVVDFVILLNRQHREQPMTSQFAREMLLNNRMTNGQ